MPPGHQPAAEPRFLGVRDTLRARFTWFSALLLLPFAVLLALGIQRIFDDDRAAAMQRLHGQRVGVERLLTNYIEGLRFKASELEKMCDFSDLDSPALRTRCTQFLRLHPELINVAVIDRRGTLRYSTAFPVTTPPQNYSQLPNASEIFGAQSYLISTAAKGPTSGRWGCVAVWPLPAQPDLLLAFPIDLQRLSAALYLGPDTTGLIVTVTDRNLRLVLTSHNPAKNIGAIRPAGAHLREELAAGRTVGTFVGVDDVPRTYDAAHLPVADWVVSAAVPTEEIYADAKNKLLRGALVGIGVILIAAAGIHYFSRALTRPVRRLAAAAHAHAAGHTDTLAAIAGPVEIAETARAFNEMVAARQRAESQLAESEHRYRTVVEQTGQLIYDLDVKTGQVRWFGRAAAEQILGHSPEELSQLGVDGWRDRLHPEERADAVARLEHSLRTGSPCKAEYRLRHRDGTYHLVDERSAILHDPQGQVDRLVGRMIDITDRAQVLHEITLRQRLLRQIIDLVPHYIFAKDRDGRFLLANESLARAHGLSPEGLLGRTDADFHPDPAEAAAYRATDLEVIDNRQSRFIAEEPHTDFRGMRRIVSTIKIPFLFPGAQGDIPALLGVAVDITDLKAAQEQRQQIEKKLLETQKLESLGVLAGGIAHDFNNLLTGILGNTGLARLSLSPGAPAQEHLLQIERAAHRAADLCKQMLAYSGKGRFVVQNLDLDELVRDSVDLLTVSISKKAQLRFNPAGRLPAIQGDATQLRQIVMNLVINASEALEERTGQITLTTGTVQIDDAYLATLRISDQLASGTAVFLEVSDTGCGMARETLSRIFDPFYTTKFTGRGLGLAAVLGIVRGHKGAIKVYSEPGAGTTFRVIFPAVPGTAQPVAPVSAETPLWHGRGHVLVIDDEEAVRLVTSGILRALGFTTDTASDGLVGLDHFRIHPERYDAVLLDLTMPNLDGEETFRQLRLLRPDVKVILMSGFNRVDAIARFVGKGLAGFIQKPFQVETLSAELRRVLDRPPAGG